MTSGKRDGSVPGRRSTGAIWFGEHHGPAMKRSRRGVNVLVVFISTSRGRGRELGGGGLRAEDGGA